MLRKSALILFLVTFVISCKLFQKKDRWDYSDTYYTDSTVTPSYYEGEEWTGYNEILFKNYRPSSTKIWDLVHTELSLQFDFAERSALGEAELTLHPHWDWQDSLILDAKGMRIKEIVEVLSPSVTGAKVSYHTPIWTYKDSLHLKIFLSKKYKRKDTLKLRVNYSSHPYASESNGNDAISEDRGLYFINHDLNDVSKPRQIWTQGETESSSRWFPTLDAPNQKTTLKIKLFVPDTMISLSNGTLIQSMPSTIPGIRMDVWEQKQPHAPYLTMVAIGNWAVVKDQWRGKPVNYLVEKKYEKYASMVFGNTPRMMEFFSDYTGVEFPWDKYSQVVVRDFVSGAMENTTATVHMEQLQHDSQEHLDNTYEDYVSHELFHQWFGDLVTTESWSNITLNESFATYGEYLWRDYAYGRTKAEDLLQELRDEYKGSGEGKHLVRYEYENEGELFDNVSYQKGACILHMLRYTVGEPAFQEALKRYLTQYAYKSAEVANLRLVFEEVTGQDLNWFFNQWYFDADHPKIQLGVEENSIDSNFVLRIEQVQSHRNCYAFPVKIKWGVGGKTYEENIFVNRRIAFLDLKTQVKPDWYIFDADNVLLFDGKLINTDLQECAANIEMLHKAFAQQPSGGVRFRLFDMACRIADENDEGMEKEILINAMRPFFKEALRSSFDHTVKKALDFSVTHPYYLDFSDGSGYRQIQDIVNQPDLNFLTKISAVNKLYYLGYQDDKLLPFTANPSPSVCLFTITRLNNKEVWVSVAKEQAVQNKNSKIATAWMRKLILNNEYSYSEGLATLAANAYVDPADYDMALNLLFYEGSDEEIPEALALLINKLKDSGKTMHLKVISVRLDEEIKALQDLTSIVDPDDPTVVYYPTKLILLGQLAEIQKGLEQR